MTEYPGGEHYVSLKKEDLQEAWEKGCPDVRNTLEFLYPDDLPPKAKEENITAEIEWRVVKGCDGGCFLWGYYKGEHIAFVNPTHCYQSKEVGVRILGAKQYKVAWVDGHIFKIIKEDG